MKSFMILWSMAGFITGSGCSVAGNCPWSTAFWRGCVVALVTAVLARWWGQIWLDNLREANRQRQYRRLAPAIKSKPTTKT